MAAALIRLDGRVSELLYGGAQPYLPRSALLALELSADFRLFFPAALAVLALWKSPIVVSLILGLFLDLAAVGLVKILFRRGRPHYNRGMSAAVAVDHFSFPSGHSSRVFFVAALLHLSKVSGSAAVWGWAAATSASRVLLGRHFAGDVIVGACLGVVEGVVAYRFLNPENFDQIRYWV